MAAEPTDFVELGEVIGGYRLERLLGAGSTSQVFLGKHVVLGRRAAIKVLVHKLIGNEDVINRLLTEAKVANDIRHPNIIDITDFINTATPRRVALVMEYVEGPSLTICREHPLTFEQAIGAMLQLVAAVRAAHAAGIIHRDIKPDNLLLTSDPRQNRKEVPTLKIVDFGIAKMAHSNLAHTAVGTMLGTPAYMAPEQIAGRPRPSAATDVFAIGEVLYEVLTSKRAYPAGTISETVRAKLRGEVPDLKLPPMPGDKALLDVIRRCLAHRPEDRPGLQEIHNTLENVRPGGERIETIEDLEDVDSDASEIETRMAGSKPLPPQATTELSPMAPDRAPMGDPTPLEGVVVPSATRIDRRFAEEETRARPLPQARRIPKDITSPTNRVLPALTEIAPFSDRSQRSEMPNAPTLPGTLNRHDLEVGAAMLIRDEQAIAMGEIRISDLVPRPSDDEASVQLSSAELSRVHAPPQQVIFDDDDPLRIAPPARARSESDDELEPIDEEEELFAAPPITAENDSALPALGLSQPAGLASFDQETDLDGLDGLDARDLDEEPSAPKPFLPKVEPGGRSDSAATVPPQQKPPSAIRPDSGPDAPDTRITEVRPPNHGSSNGLFYGLLVVIGCITAIALLVATGKLDLKGSAPASPKVEAREVPATDPIGAAKPGLFRIQSDPPGADVMHVSEDPDSDPLPLGKTPLEFQLTGETWPQMLRIVHPEYESFDVKVTPDRRHIDVKMRKK